jgi:hypothetical protein
MLQQRSTMFQESTGIATDQFAFFLQETLSSKVMQMGPDHASGPTQIVVVQTDSCK